MEKKSCHGRMTICCAFIALAFAICFGCCKEKRVNKVMSSCFRRRVKVNPENRLEDGDWLGFDEFESIQDRTLEQTDMKKEKKGSIVKYDLAAFAIRYCAVFIYFMVVTTPLHMINFTWNLGKRLIFMVRCCRRGNSVVEENKPEKTTVKTESEKETSFFSKMKKYFEKKYAVISNTINLVHFESSPVLTDNL
jgi:hypothetical protein